jgi:hypothetical protein
MSIWRVTTMGWSLVLMMTAGCMYAFSAYAMLLKDRLNINQGDLMLIGSLSNVGTYLSAIPLGLLFVLFADFDFAC